LKLKSRNQQGTLYLTIMSWSFITVIRLNFSRKID